MNILSLFDGLSGAQIALNRAGIAYDNYFASEVDKYAIKVTMQNYPDTIQLGDIRQIKSSGLPKIELIIGGSPCQGFSRAGKQLNFDDHRSALFFEYVRLLEECKPKYFLLENVRMKREHLEVISEILKTEPILINSALVSAQNRRRYYWTNIPGARLPIADRGILLQDVIDDAVTDKEKSYCINAYYCNTWNNYKYYLKKSRGQLVWCKLTKKWRKLTPVECERLQTVPDFYTEGISNTQRYRMLGNGFTVDIIVELLKGLK